MSTQPPPTDLFHRASPLDPLVIPSPPRVIVAHAQPGPWPVAAPDARSHGYVRAHANASRNGRVPFALPRGGWRVRPPVTVPGARRVAEVLDGAQYIVARTDIVWIVADHDGSVIATGACDPGELVVDPARAELLCVGSSGGVEARSLSDGARRWVAGVFSGRDFDHPMLHRHGSLLVSLGVERALHEHGPWRAEQSVFEALDLGDPVAVDADGWAIAKGAPRRLFRKTTRVLAAWHDDKLVVAADDRLYRISATLDVLDVQAEGFTPLALSVDEAGSAWMVTRTAQGTMLVVVNPAGETTFWTSLPLDGRSVPPPIVSHAHRGFVVLDEAVLVVGPDGLAPWKKPIEGAVVGATVTGDDHLLVAFRNELVFYDDEGRIDERIPFPHDVLTTAPALTARGEILVGGVGVIHRVAVV